MSTHAAIEQIFSVSIKIVACVALTILCVGEDLQNNGAACVVARAGKTLSGVDPKPHNTNSLGILRILAKVRCGVRHNRARDASAGGQAAPPASSAGVSITFKAGFSVVNSGGRSRRSCLAAG